MLLFPVDKLLQLLLLLLSTYIQAFDVCRSRMQSCAGPACSCLRLAHVSSAGRKIRYSFMLTTRYVKMSIRKCRHLHELKDTHWGRRVRQWMRVQLRAHVRTKPSRSADSRDVSNLDLTYVVRVCSRALAPVCLCLLMGKGACVYRYVEVSICAYAQPYTLSHFFVCTGTPGSAAWQRFRVRLPI